jgi:segregation and condensation protein B
MDDLKNIIESLLFVAETPIPLDRFKEVLEAEDTKEIRGALEQLSEEYDQRKGGIFLSEVAGGYQIRTRPEYHEYVKRLLKPSAHRLSNAALETLAIIAYKQPIIRADVEHLRGVDCGGVLRVLMEKKLIRVLGRKEIPGRPLIYATTKHFLEVFELKNLKDLPSPKEIERHTDLPQEKLAAAALLDPNVDSESPEKVETPSKDDQTGDVAASPSDDHAGETETPPLGDHTGEMETTPRENNTGETEAIPSEDQPPDPPGDMPREQEDTSGEEKNLDLEDQSPI